MTQPAPTPAAPPAPAPATPATPAPAAPSAPAKPPPAAAQTPQLQATTAAPVAPPAPDVAKPPEPSAAAAAPKPGEKARARIEQLRAQNREREARTQQIQQQQAQASQYARQQADRAAAAEQAKALADQRAQQLENADPYEYLEKRGISPKDLIDKAKEAADPVAQIRKIAEAAQAEAKALREERDARERQAAEERENTARINAIRTAEDNLVKSASDEKLYPHLSKIAKTRRSAILAEVKDIIRDVHARAATAGQPPPSIPDHEILSYLESEWSKASFLAAPSPAASPASSTTAPAAPQGGPSPTLTNRDSTEVASLPPDRDKLSKAEQKALDVETYRRLRDARRARATQE